MARTKNLVKEPRARLNIYLAPSLKQFFEDSSKELGTNVSAVVVMALKQYVDSQKALTMTGDLKEMIQKMQKQQITK